jgi:hypothetical protein
MEKERQLIPEILHLVQIYNKFNAYEEMSYILNLYYTSKSTFYFPDSWKLNHSGALRNFRDLNLNEYSTYFLGIDLDKGCIIKYLEIKDYDINPSQALYNDIIDFLLTAAEEEMSVTVYNNHTYIYDYHDIVWSMFKTFHNIPQNFVYYVINQSRDKNIDSYIKAILEFENNNKIMKNEKPKKKNNFVLKCPNTECINGYVDESYVCLLCNKRFCHLCFKELTENHECDKNDVKTFKDILKNTKPCPKCGERIFKNGGCSQMFCTLCHCCFDWNTGQLITKYFHNPHHEEWIRNHGLENTMNNNCDGVIVLANKKLHRFNIGRREIMYDIERLEERNRNIESKYVKLRFLKLINRLSDEDYRKKIVGLTNKRSYETIVVSIYREFDQIVNDIVRAQKQKEITMVHDEEYDKYCENNNIEAIQLIREEINYTNTLLKNVAHGWYNRKPYIIYVKKYI